MNKTIITKLKGIVTNDDILKLGELRIPCYGNGETRLINNSNGLISCGTLPVVYNILNNPNVVFQNGTQTFSNLEGTNNIQSITTNQSYTLQCLNKYNIISLRVTDNNQNVNVSKEFDISELKYLPNLTLLEIVGDNFAGNIDDLLKYSKINYLVANGKNISLDLSNISHNTVFNYLQLNSKSITGNISDFKNIKIKNMLDWAFVISNSNISGDLADLPSSVCYINAPSVPVKWTKGKRANASVLAINSTIDQKVFATSTDVDNMFIDQSTCTYNGTSLSDQHGGSVHKIKISCVQDYTPSLEAQEAIKKIYAKGITDISVNNVNMENYKS